MAVIVIVAAVVFGVALAIREYQLGKERALLAVNIQELRAALESTRSQLRRVVEDVYVMQTLMAEHNMFDEGEMARARLRLIEAPRRMAEERAAMARHLKISPTQLLIDPTDAKIH